MKTEKLTEQRRLHKCSACDKDFFWNSESKWYGKSENKSGREIVEFKACSDQCFELIRERVWK